MWEGLGIGEGKVGNQRQGCQTLNKARFLSGAGTLASQDQSGWVQSNIHPGYRVEGLMVT